MLVQSRLVRLLTGFAAGETDGWDWKKAHDPEVLPEVSRRWRAAIESGQRAEMTFPLRGADGVFRPFLTRVVPHRDADGVVVRWFGISTDVSEFRAIETQLRDSEARYRSAMALWPHRRLGSRSRCGPAQMDA